MYAEIVQSPKFYLDELGNYFPEATTFILTGNHLKYLCNLFHSKTITYIFKTFYAGGGLGENGFRYKKAYFEKRYIEKYGEHSYYNSRIYLEVSNLDNGKKFEIDVNPFAKSWFIHIYEPNCKYAAKLCRTINNEKVDIAASNPLMVPTNAPHFPPDTTF